MDCDEWKPDLRNPSACRMVRVENGKRVFRPMSPDEDAYYGWLANEPGVVDHIIDFIKRRAERFRRT